MSIVNVLFYLGKMWQTPQSRTAGAHEVPRRCTLWLCRAFMQERLLGRADGGAELGEAVLYFGCRRCDQDYLYGDLLEGWAANGDLTLFTAFSRQQV